MTKNLYLPDVSDKLPFGERLRALRTRVAFGMIGIAGGDNDDNDDQSIIIIIKIMMN